MNKLRSPDKIVKLSELVEIFSLPTPLEVLRDEGMEVSGELYEKIVFRLSKAIFNSVSLSLSLTPDEGFLISPAGLDQWREAAFWLGHVVNLDAGKEVMLGPEDILSPRWDSSRDEPYAGYEQAVLTNLHLVGLAPKALGLADPALALKKALAEAVRIQEVRRLSQLAA